MSPTETVSYPESASQPVGAASDSSKHEGVRALLPRSHRRQVVRAEYLGLYRPRRTPRRRTTAWQTSGRAARESRAAQRFVRVHAGPSLLTTGPGAPIARHKTRTSSMPLSSTPTDIWVTPHTRHSPICLAPRHKPATLPPSLLGPTATNRFDWWQTPTSSTRKTSTNWKHSRPNFHLPSQGPTRGNGNQPDAAQRRFPRSTR